MVEAGLKIEKEKDGGFRIILAGDWMLGNQLPSVQAVAGELGATDGSPGVAFDTREIGAWDSGLLIFLLAVIGHCERQKVAVERSGLPAGVNRLLTLATAVPEQQGARQGSGHLSLLARIGETAIGFWQSLLELLNFVGETAASFFRLCTGKAQYLFTQESAIMEDAAGNTYEALVAAMGRAVGKLGREMADRLAPLIPKGNPRRSD